MFLSFVLTAACSSSLLGQSIIFQDDFSTSEANGDPSNLIWGTNVRNPSVDKTIKVTNADSFNYFGKANDGYLHHRHVAGATGSLFIEANGKFTTPTSVVTVAFDFFMPSTTSWGAANTFADPRFRLGVSGAFASNNARSSNEIRFYGDTGSASAYGFSGKGGLFSQDTLHSVFVVYNHSTASVNYDSGLTVESSRYDIWIDGVRVLAGGGVNNSLLALGTPLTTIGFGSFAGGSEAFIDNLVVYEGAQVIPEPSTYAFGAGLLALGGALFFRRRRAA